MINAILGKKLEMSQKFREDGRCLPINRIQAGPCAVVEIKTQERDGYQAFVLGFGEKKEKRIKKPFLGKLKKAGIGQKPAFLREIRIDDNQKEGNSNLKIGDLVNLGDIFKVGDLVDVTGISKGKGFAGVVKRWSFAGGPATHGQSDRPRAPGSIGSTTTPGRVLKGKKMAGRLGGERVTVENLEVVGLEPEKNILEVRGAVPGNRGGLVIVRKAKKVN